MIVFHEERIVPTDVNVLVFAGKDNTGYFYVHRNLYDQAVILQHLYGEDIGQLYELLGGEGHLRDDVEYFYSMSPEPIKSLAPFLLLVKEPIENYMDMVGAIHVISTQCDMVKMVHVPESIRVSLKFSLHITEEYQLSWDRFLKSSMTYSEPILLPPYVQQLSFDGNVPNEDVAMERITAPGATDEEQQELDDLADLMALLGAPVDEINSVRRGEATIIDEPNDEITSLVSEPTSYEESEEKTAEIFEQEPEPEPEPVAKAPSGLDLVRSFALKGVS